MNVLVLAGRVPAPDECERTSLDGSWLQDLAAVHELTIAVDEDSPVLTTLRGCAVVHVSDKRHVYLPGGRLVDADTTLAGWIRARHAERPFDLVVASSERPSVGVVREALPGVRWAVAAATGPGAHAHRLALDPDFVASHGRELWCAASRIATAELVLSPVAPAALGLRTRRQTTTLLPVPTPEIRPNVEGDLVVVVATGVAASDATELLERALGTIDVHASTTIVVLHTPPPAAASDVGPMLAAGVPTELERQVVLVPVGRHSTAGAWVQQADALVLTDASELLIPLVARRAAAVPTVCVGAAPVHTVRVSTTTTAPPPVPAAGVVELLPWTRPSAVAAELRRLRRLRSPDVVVIHDARSTTRAAGWQHTTGIDVYDVLVAATSKPPWSMPHTGRLDGGLVALGRRTWNVVADELTGGATLPGLVARLTDVSGGRSHTLGVISVEGSVTTVSPGRTHPALPLAGGPLPDLRLPATTVPPSTVEATITGGQRPVAASASSTSSIRGWAKATRWAERAQLARPWQLGLATTLASGDHPPEVVRWVRSHGIRDRARLVLPWKWGLLPRSMEGRW